MKKSEALRASFFLRQAYKCFIGNIDKGILVGNPFMPSNDDIKAFSDYILENDDRNLYDATFGLMDRQLISNAYWRLFEELNIKGLKEKILKDCDGDMKRYYANDVVCMFHSLAAIHREMITLGDIFDASTTDCPNGNNTDTLTERLRLPQPKHTKQQQKNQPERGKGRPKETLKDKMINDADGSKLQKVHTVMKGKKGKDAALIVLACMKKGWMQKPTFTQVAEEFGDIGVQQGFTKYLNENRFTKDEIEGAMNSLE